MRCSKCGTESENDRKCCAACGSAISGRRRKCGAENAASSAYCEDCGTALTFTTAPAPTSPVQTGSTAPAVHIARVRPAADALQGERKTMTALFADIKGSMDLMEDIDPEEARAMLVEI